MSLNFDKLKTKLETLADAAKYDASCSSSGGKRKRAAGGMGNSEGTGICHSYTPDGRCISLLKILLTNFCIYDCKYCINRASSDVKRARFSPQEVIDLTLEFYRRNYIEGLFLSSGIIQSSDYTMEQLIKVAKTLRLEHKFGGYIHLKMVAGASDSLNAEAALWADRVSANIELPSQQDLDSLAPEKKMSEATDAMSVVRDKTIEYNSDRKKFKSTPKFAPAGQSTQIIVGATKSSDSLIMHASEKLYTNFSLRRVYYSAYSPIPLPHKDMSTNAPPLRRENRLYQADWLIRFYGFKVSELFKKDDNLDLTIDPKTSWALGHQHFFPINVNTAPKKWLLRVPGLGGTSIMRILKMRIHRKIYYHDLVKLGVCLKRARYFIETADANRFLINIDKGRLDKILRPSEVQLSLF